MNCQAWIGGGVHEEGRPARICSEIDEQVHEFLHRLIEHTWFPYPFLDATYLDFRVRGRVVSQALVVATGVSGDGREILGMTLGDAETPDFWTEFPRSLRERGLKVATDADPLGVALVTSDAHAGIMAIRRTPLPLRHLHAETRPHPARPRRADTP